MISFIICLLWLAAYEALVQAGVAQDPNPRVAGIFFLAFVVSLLDALLYICSKAKGPPKP